jgi:hypothetical membrane protein
MLSKRLVNVGVLGLVAVGLYVGAVILGGILDPGYSHVRNAISELTGSQAPNPEVLAPIFIGYNVVLAGFAYALMVAAGSERLVRIAFWLFAVGAVSGTGQVSLFRMDSVGADATTAGTIHLVLAGVSSLLTLATAVLYGFAFRRQATYRRLSTYSFVTALLLVLSAPAAVVSIGTDVMGLFERLTIGVFLAWVVVVSAFSLLAARSAASKRAEIVSAAA